MIEIVIKPKSLGVFVRSLSGLFITKTNPTGLTPKECIILAALIYVLDEKNTRIITKEIKEELANMTNHSLQVITNYINKFRIKDVVTSSNTINSIFYKDKIIIESWKSL